PKLPSGSACVAMVGGDRSSRVETQRLISRLQTAFGPQSVLWLQLRPTLSQRIRIARPIPRKIADTSIFGIGADFDRSRESNEPSPAFWMLMEQSFHSG